MGKKPWPRGAQNRDSRLDQDGPDATEWKTPFNKDNRKDQSAFSHYGSIDKGNSGAHGLFKIGHSLYQQQIRNSGLRQQKRPLDGEQGFPAQIVEISIQRKA
jgi:hypothetical protein